jgi:transcriptional regulator with XRE-family HTH domain
MTPRDLQAIRKKMGLTVLEMADALGFTGAHRQQHYRRMERGLKPITPVKAREIREAFQRMTNQGEST